MDRNSLWFKVLSTRYGVEGGRVSNGGRDVSAWWRDISAMRATIWFSSHVTRTLGDGSNSLFWTDVWVGEVSLRKRFTRLYDLSLLKGESVFLMFTLGWGVDGAVWSWRRRLFAWEEELVGALMLLLLNVTLQVDRVDRWIWRLDTSSTYSVRSAYNYLNVQALVDLVVPVSSLWHKDVPLKVVLFAWRLFRDRLPSKDNLFRRCVIDINAQNCVGGCNLQETSAHLFLHCNLFGSESHFSVAWCLCCFTF